MLACLTTLASATTPKKPPMPPVHAVPAQTPEQLTVLEALAGPIPAPELAPPAITAPGAVTSQVVTYLLGKTGQPGPKITFPASAATAQAIRRFASQSISHRPGRCAASMREAMGWGLGDAHQWVSLPQMGFSQRVGEPAQAGDIVVWPFSYGSRRSQHIGIAVGTDNGVRLLSNLSGSICLAPLAPGYRAFYKLQDFPEPPPGTLPLPMDPRSGLTRLPTAPEAVGLGE